MSSENDTLDLSDAETESGYRSRSQSRRARRKKQSGKTPKKNQMPSVPENQQASAQSSAQSGQGRNQNQAQAQSSAQAQQQQKQQEEIEELPEQSRPGAMQPFEWIGPDSTSMDGPVTYARAMRGEIPMREGNPNQGLATGRKPGGEGGEQKDPMDQDGLKLRIELNIDIEIELKARIHGDLTLALL